MKKEDDRFAPVAANYDRWIQWEPRLKKEMPFLTGILPARAKLLDVGCGTGAHALALAAAGYEVVGLDVSEAMLEQARGASNEPRAANGPAAGSGSAKGTGIQHGSAKAAERRAVEWILGDILDPAVLAGRRFDAVLALGNALLSVGEEEKVLGCVRAMVEHVAPGGMLVLQYLNGTRIRNQDRVVVKAQDPGACIAGAAGGRSGPGAGGTTEAGAGSGAHDPADTRSGAGTGGRPGAASGEIWLRHHFVAGNDLYFHSYVLRPEKGAWTAEVRGGRLVDLTPERIRPLLEPCFASIELFDGLSGGPLRPLESDSIGVIAKGRIR